MDPKVLGSIPSGCTTLPLISLKDAARAFADLRAQIDALRIAVRALMRTMTATGLALALLAWNSVGAIAQDDGDPDAGRDFARGVCSTCHEVEGLDAPSPHPDAPVFRVIANVPGMTATALYVVLNNPHRQMPDLILAPDELHDVVAYILTLKDGD